MCEMNGKLFFLYVFKLQKNSFLPVSPTNGIWSTKRRRREGKNRSLRSFVDDLAILGGDKARNLFIRSPWSICLLFNRDSSNCIQIEGPRSLIHQAHLHNEAQCKLLALNRTFSFPSFLLRRLLRVKETWDNFSLGFSWRNIELNAKKGGGWKKLEEIHLETAEIKTRRFLIRLRSFSRRRLFRGFGRDFSEAE
jgi:hypothetical protein